MRKFFKLTLVFVCLFLVIIGKTSAQTSTAFSQDKRIPYGHNDSVGKFYDIRGIKIYTEVYGTGKPLLMIHGNGGNMGAFARTIPVFAKSTR